MSLIQKKSFLPWPHFSLQLLSYISAPFIAKLLKKIVNTPSLQSFFLPDPLPHLASRIRHSGFPPPPQFALSEAPLLFFLLSLTSYCRRDPGLSAWVSSLLSILSPFWPPPGLWLFSALLLCLLSASLSSLCPHIVQNNCTSYPPSKTLFYFFFGWGWGEFGWLERKESYVHFLINNFWSWRIH